MPIRKLFTNRIAYLSVSLVLMLIALPLISIGTTGGPGQLWWWGLGSLLVGAAILPIQRLLYPPQDDEGEDDEEPDAGPADASADGREKP